MTNIVNVAVERAQPVTAKSFYHNAFNSSREARPRQPDPVGFASPCADSGVAAWEAMPA